MRTNSRLGILVILLTGLWSMPSQSQDVETLILSAKQKLAEGQNGYHPAKIMEARVIFKQASTSDSSRALALYYIALSDYRLAGINNGTPDQLENLNSCIDVLGEVIRIDDSFVEAYALLGSALGWKTGLKPIKALTLGTKANRMVAKAMEMQPDNPRVAMIAAISDLNKPKMFGGDKKRALEGFQKAAMLFANEEVSDPTQPAWGKDEVYAWLGQAFVAMGASDQARAAYEKALEINPDYGWVKTILLPELAAQDY